MKTFYFIRSAVENPMRDGSPIKTEGKPNTKVVMCVIQCGLRERFHVRLISSHTIHSIHYRRGTT